MLKMGTHVSLKLAFLTPLLLLLTFGISYPSVMKVVDLYLED